MAVQAVHVIEVRYVAGLMFDGNGNVLLVRKARPKWMAGKLNAIGGHVEAGEQPIDAMVREFKEETGIDTSIPSSLKSYWRQFLQLRAKDGSFRVDFFWCKTFAQMPRFENLDKEEPVFQISNNYVLTGERSRQFMPNLGWITAMALADMQGDDRCDHFTVIEDHHRAVDE